MEAHYRKKRKTREGEIGMELENHGFKDSLEKCYRAVLQIGHEEFCRNHVSTQPLQN